MSFSKSLANWLIQDLNSDCQLQFYQQSFPKKKQFVKKNYFKKTIKDIVTDKTKFFRETLEYFF